MAHLHNCRSIKFVLISFAIFSGLLLFMYNSYYIPNDCDGDGGIATFYENDNTKILLEQMIYLDRQEHLSKMCQIYSKENNTDNSIDELSSDTEFLEHVLVDAKHKLLYCYVPKVACTNWKRVFMILSGMANSSDPLAIPADLVHKRGVFLSLNNFTVPEIKRMLNTFTKFVFVRHPFERLLSAYRNKFESNYVRSSYFQSRFGRYIIKNFRPNPSKDSLEKGDDVTFPEFAAYLTAPENTTFNEHWKAVYNLCRPCLIKYDFIGKYESLYRDSDHLLKLAGILPSTFPKFKPSNTTDQLKKYYTMLSSQTIMQLYNLYYMDFKLFNYNLEGFLGYEIG